MLTHGLRPLFLACPVTQLLQFAVGVVHAQLVLQHLHLLPQVVIALLLIEVERGFALNLALEFKQLHLFEHVFEQQLRLLNTFELL